MKALAIALTALIAGMGIGITTDAMADTNSPVITWISHRVCAQEDSVNCAWDAKVQGNGEGHSFIVREFPGRKHMTCYLFQNRKYARNHDYCFNNR